MKKLARIIPILSLFLIVAAPLIVHAAEKKAKSEIVMKMGSKVHLFHSSNVEAQKEIAIGDVLSVFRVSARTQQKKEVGQVKVLGFMGEHYFEAEIVKGEIKVGDIAKKENLGLLVQPAK
jgi:hypothetical protein